MKTSYVLMAAAAVAAGVFFWKKGSTGSTKIVSVTLDSLTHRGRDYVTAAVGVHYDGPPKTLTMRMYYGTDIGQVTVALVTTGPRDLVITVPYNLNYKQPGAYPVKAVLYDTNKGTVLAQMDGGTLTISG